MTTPNDRSLGIEISPQELAGLSRLLSTAAVNIGQPEIAREIRQVVLADVDERFSRAPSVETGGVVYGGVFWPPLSPSSLAQRPERIGGQLLRDTGELQQSFTASGAIFKRGPGEVVVGTALPKARGLQFGVFWGVEIPELARPMLFMHDQLADDVMEAIGIAFDRLQRGA
jgi:phage gpG-like protein